MFVIFLFNKSHFGGYLDCKRPLMHPFDEQRSLNYHIIHTMYIKCKYDCFKRLILILMTLRLHLLINHRLFNVNHEIHETILYSYAVSRCYIATFNRYLKISGGYVDSLSDP